jgi:hypothetical protein
MTPEQLQTYNSAMVSEGAPTWMKAVFVLILLSNLATTVCLPLIVWKLYACNKKPKSQSQLTDDQRRIQLIREKRESLQASQAEKVHTTEQLQPVSVADFSASGAGVPEPLEGDSRYLPPD